MPNYLIQVDSTVYEQSPYGEPRPAKRDAVPQYFTLPEALRAVYGCRNAHILREGPLGEMTMVVRNAGRAFSDLTHEPSERVIRRGRSVQYVGLSLRWMLTHGWPVRAVLGFDKAGV